MADPATAMIVAGVGMQVFGSISGARSARRQARNARALGEFEAKEIERRSFVDIANIRRATPQFLAQQAAAFSAAGVDVGSGSALIAMEQSARILAERITETRGEAQFRAQITRMSANFRAQSLRDEARAQNIGAIGSVISGVGSFL